MEDLQIKEEAIEAAREHFSLNPFLAHFPFARFVSLEGEERQRYTHKLALVLAGQPALAFRLAAGVYRVEADPARSLQWEEQQECEFYRACLCASHYLEKEPGHAARFELATITPPPGAPYTRRWRFSFDMASCDIVRYDEAACPRYEVWEEGT